MAAMTRSSFAPRCLAIFFFLLPLGSRSLLLLPNFFPPFGPRRLGCQCGAVGSTRFASASNTPQGGTGRATTGPYAVLVASSARTGSVLISGSFFFLPSFQCVVGSSIVPAV
uniref:Putative secreted protein n=1 Tax=Ixodes ricinus TaxID=34613 RepID=A0A6B0UJV9_IXORI